MPGPSKTSTTSPTSPNLASTSRSITKPIRQATQASTPAIVPAPSPSGPLDLATYPRLSTPNPCAACPLDLLLLLFHDGTFHIDRIALTKLSSDGKGVKSVMEAVRGADMNFVCPTGCCAKFANAYVLRLHWTTCNGTVFKDKPVDSLLEFNRRTYSSWWDAHTPRSARPSRHDSIDKIVRPGPFDLLPAEDLFGMLAPARRISHAHLAPIGSNSSSSSSSLSSLVGSAAITPSTSTSTLASSIDEAPATPLFLHFDDPSTLTLDDACGTFILKNSQHVLPPFALDQPGPWLFLPALRRSGSLTDLQQEGTSSRNRLRPSASLSDLRATLLREDQAGVSPVISSLASSSASAATTDSVWWKRRELPLEEMFQKGFGLGTQSE